MQNRRTFLLLVAAAAVAVLLQFASAQATCTPHPTDVDILNFALNLEYLEAEFYSWAAFGKGLPADLRGNGPPATGGRKAKLSTYAQAYAEAIALDEIAHVRLLRKALGKHAVPQPHINIGTAFAAAANAAFNTTLKPSFSPYANDLFFYHGAFIFEDVGVTAYKGAAPLLKSKAYLSAAAGLLGTEAYHAGAIRAILLPQAKIMTPYKVLVSTIVQAISNLRDAADGKGDKDQGLFDAKGRPVLAPGDKNRIAYDRTVAQVLKIVSLGGKANKGGFFPNGLSGCLK